MWLSGPNANTSSRALILAMRLLNNSAWTWKREDLECLSDVWTNKSYSNGFYLVHRKTLVQRCHYLREESARNMADGKWQGDLLWSFRWRSMWPFQSMAVGMGWEWVLKRTDRWSEQMGIVDIWFRYHRRDSLPIQSDHHRWSTVNWAVRQSNRIHVQYRFHSNEPLAGSGWLELLDVNVADFRRDSARKKTKIR